MPRFDRPRPHSSQQRAIFSIHLNSASGVTLTSNTLTQVMLDSPDFTATGPAFDTVNGQYKPTVAGKYQFNASVNFSATAAMTTVVVEIHKNGAVVARFQHIGGSDTATVSGGPPSLINLNGTTDTVTLWAKVVSAGTITVTGGSTLTGLSGFWVGP